MASSPLPHLTLGRWQVQAALLSLIQAAGTRAPQVTPRDSVNCCSLCQGPKPQAGQPPAAPGPPAHLKPRAGKQRKARRSSWTDRPAHFSPNCGWDTEAVLAKAARSPGRPEGQHPHQTISQLGWSRATVLLADSVSSRGTKQSVPLLHRTDASSVSF